MDDIYEIDCVLDVRNTKRGKRYLIRWKQDDANSWEPEENLVDCQEAIDSFYTKRKQEDEDEKSQELKTPNHKKSVKKQKTEVKSHVRTTRKVTVTQETEIRPTPLTRRSARLSEKNEELKSPMKQPEELSQMTKSSKICANTKKCPVKYFAYILCLIMIFVIVFMSLPKFTDDADNVKQQ